MSPYINSVKLNRSKFQGDSSFNFGICVFILILFVIAGFYIYLFNLNVEVAYKSDNLSSQLKQLDNDNQLLTIELSGVYSLENLKTRAEALNLVEVKSAKFLEISDKQLVKR